MDPSGGISTVGGDRHAAEGRGALIAAPANPIINVAVAAWRATAQADTDTSAADARTALMDVAIADGRVATLAVLQATSHASWRGTTSHGDASSDAAAVTLFEGAARLTLLHSESSSDHPGAMRLVSVDGNEVVSTPLQGDPVVIAVPGVARVRMLEVTVAPHQGWSDVGSVDDLGGSRDVIGVLTTEATTRPDR